MISSLLRPIKEFFKEQSLLAYTAREGISTFVLKILTLGLAFLVSILLARLLGSSGYGTYAYTLSWINLLSVLAVFGQDRLIIREGAVLMDRKHWETFRGLLIWSNGLVLILSLVLCAITGLVGWHLMTPDNHVIITTWWVSLLILPLMSLTALRRCALQGLQKIAISHIPEDVVRPVIYLCLLGVTYAFFRGDASPPVIMGLNVIASVCGFCVGIYLLWSHLPPQVKQARPHYDSSVWLKAAYGLSFLGALHIVNREIRTILLGTLATTHEVGLFTIAQRGSELIALPLVVINVVAAPVFATLYAKKDHTALQSAVTKSAVLILALSLPIALGLVLFGEHFLALFGQDFTEAGNTLTILCVGTLVNASMGSVGMLLTMTGKERYASRTVAISVVLNIVLSVLLIPRFGAEGAALSHAVTLVAVNGLFAYWVYTKLGIRPTALALLPALRRKESGWTAGASGKKKGA